MLAAILRQVDEMMFSIGRSYRGGRRWARMRTRDWLVLRPEWSVDPLEISVELGSALGVLLVKDAEELGSWLSVDYQSLASRMLDGAKPPWLLRALKENEGAETHDYSYADVVKRGPRGWGPRLLSREHVHLQNDNKGGRRRRAAHRRAHAG